MFYDSTQVWEQKHIFCFETGGARFNLKTPIVELCVLRGYEHMRLFTFWSRWTIILKWLESAFEIVWTIFAICKINSGLESWTVQGSHPLSGWRRVCMGWAQYLLKSRGMGLRLKQWAMILIYSDNHHVTNFGWVEWKPAINYYVPLLILEIQIVTVGSSEKVCLDICW